MINIIHRLRMARGSIAKIEILKQESNNKDWLTYLRWVYDTQINYYNGVPNDSSFIEDHHISHLFFMLKEYSEGKYKGNKGKRISLACSKRHGELWRLALGRSIKAGVSIVTINKAYPGLIPTFDVMLAKDVPVKEFPVYVSTKYDGVRLIVINKHNSVKALTRAGKYLYIFSLVTQMGQLPEGVYDGELVAGNGKQESRTTITGSVNKCLLGTATDIEDYTYCVFDYITLKEWKKRKTSSFHKRQKRIRKHADLFQYNIKLAEQWVLHNNAQVEEMFKERLEAGYEGLILRYGSDPYIWSRTEQLIKKKATKEAVLKCVGVKKGKGKYKGLIGALKCKGVVEGKKVKVSIGSGLTDMDREEHFTGSKVEILYNDVVKQKDTDKYSLFLPRYKRKLGDNDV